MWLAQVWDPLDVDGDSFVIENVIDAKVKVEVDCLYSFLVVAQDEVWSLERCLYFFLFQNLEMDVTLIHSPFLRVPDSCDY